MQKFNKDFTVIPKAIEEPKEEKISLEQIAVITAIFVFLIGLSIICMAFEILFHFKQDRLT